jgi:DNA-binding CsgD family transcriptional regulator
MKENIERNKQIYELRSLGYTIEEISLITGIPRSTVGYYVKKFKKYENEGKPLKLAASSKHDISRNEPASSNVLGSFLMKFISLQEVPKWTNALLNRGEFDKLYYFLMSIKCAFELSKYFRLTPEELKLPKESLSAFKVEEPKMNIGEAGGQTPLFSGAETGKPRKSLEEIVQQQMEKDKQDRIRWSNHMNAMLQHRRRLKLL